MSLKRRLAKLDKSLPKLPDQESPESFRLRFRAWLRTLTLDEVCEMEELMRRGQAEGSTPENVAILEAFIERVNKAASERATAIQASATE